MISLGRVNLLGEYIDYNDGVVLPAAINRYVTMAIKPRGDDRVILHVLDLDASVEFSLMEVAYMSSLPYWCWIEQFGGSRAGVC